MVILPHSTTSSLSVETDGDGWAQRVVDAWRELGDDARPIAEIRP